MVLVDKEEEEEITAALNLNFVGQGQCHHVLNLLFLAF